jgi:hypothetical protein|tara:strand:- start:208 stop:471 length:264 start_codon:yes stop_codon:yes gene_type:complete
MIKHEVLEKGAVSNRDLWLGLFFGLLLGIIVAIIYDRVEPFMYSVPNDIICQKGKAFEAVEYESSVYLKTSQECLDTRLIEGGSDGK